MNILIWIITALLAAIFAMAGIMKLTRSKEQLVNSGLGWAADYPPAAIRLIAAAELLAALGLILPALFGIAEILVPLAATGLAIIMIGAIITHARRHETQMIIINLILLAAAVFVAVMRFGPEAF